MKTQTQCSCMMAPKLIFPCSGASDVGGLSDQAARQMAKDGMGKIVLPGGDWRARGCHHGEHAERRAVAGD